MAADETERARRELNRAAERARASRARADAGPDNPELDDSQARGGAEMASEQGRTKEEKP